MVNQPVTNVESNAYSAIKDYLDGRLDLDMSVRIINNSGLRGIKLAMLVYGLSGHKNQDGYYRMNSWLQDAGLY